MRKELVYAALGFGSGAAIAWAVTADIYEKRLKEQLTYVVNVNNIDDDPIESSVEIETADPNQTELILDQRHLDDPYDEPVQPDVPEGETEEQTRSNLETLIDTYTADPQAREDFAASTRVIPGSENTPPFVISREDYAFDDEGQSYAKITVTYYPHDRVLLDDDDEPMDIARIIGYKNLNRFGDESEDPNVVFIRNHRMETDFEVVKEEEARLPLHVSYGMEKEEFHAHKAAGLIKGLSEDE